MQPDRTDELVRLFDQRIAILDGAMGTMLQRRRLDERAFRGAPGCGYCAHDRDLKGDNDLLSITQPSIVGSIHDAYLEAGADLIETNTFSATAISQGDYGLAAKAREMNRAAAALAREHADRWTARTPRRPRYVAGALGPTNRTASISPDVNDPSARNVTFDELSAAYREAAAGLVEGGADLLLIETVFDTLNAKAAIHGVLSLFDDLGARLPLGVSGTITDASGRTLSGQTPEAFWNSVRHAEPLFVGLNCALGAALMRPYIEELAHVADVYVSCYPNAGLPNPMSESGYDETPAETAALVAEFAQSGFVNLAGGCCGTTPAHVRAIAEAVAGIAPRRLPGTLAAAA